MLRRSFLLAPLVLLSMSLPKVKAKTRLFYATQNMDFNHPKYGKLLSMRWINHPTYKGYKVSEVNYEKGVVQWIIWDNTPENKDKKNFICLQGYKTQKTLAQ